MIINIEIYNNHIRETKELSLSAACLEDAVKHYEYKGERRIKDSKVEDMLLPPIALVFYDLLYKYDIVPSPEDLVEAYFNQPYFCYVPDNQVEVDYNESKCICNVESIEARVLRAYPSLLRDLHFYLMANESGLFDAVRYSFQKDYKEKIDIQVLYRNRWYNVGLLLNSHRSLWYKFKKQFRHKPTDVIYIELDANSCYFCGDYMLYTEQHIQQLCKKVKHY